MARIAQDSTPKRRSARISSNQTQSTKKTSASGPGLDVVLEREETPDTAQLASIDNVISTPKTRKEVEHRLKELSRLTTPKTEPKVADDQMHPATIHQTTAKAPDSGLKLGFADIQTTGRASLASLQNTPSRPRQSMAHSNISPGFQFKFSHESAMSNEGRKLMESIREDAAKIKEEMRAQKARQEEKDAEAESMFDTATGRKIAKPTAKAGRFSDIHMTEFKKMDSIANHASAFRARPGFARPTTQSLKRSSSKADLDDMERPKTAGKSPSTRIPPPITGRLSSTSPFKSIRSTSSYGNDMPAKRLRREDDVDVSSGRTTNLPQPVSSRLLSPTKASAARRTNSTVGTPKSPAVQRANSVRSIRSVNRPSISAKSPTKLPQLHYDKPLPPTPAQAVAPSSTLDPSPSHKASAPVEVKASSSRIPMIAGLKSILRSPKKGTSPSRKATPKHNDFFPAPPSSQKKVDFTPSVKSRYAVKLAEASPSPAKLDRSILPAEHYPAIPYDSSSFVVSNDQDWEDDDNEIIYPALPIPSPRSTHYGGPVDHTIQKFAEKAKDMGRRESKEFKSIFTTLHPKKDNPSSLTSANTIVNRTDPITNATRVAVSPTRPSVQSPSTIRQVRNSEPVQPFEDRIDTVPHGLPGKKRRHDSAIANDKFGHDDDAKENRRITHAGHILGSWNDDTIDNGDINADTEDESTKRAGKRARTSKTHPLDSGPKPSITKSPIKKPKPNAARELAAKTAKDRKAKANFASNSASHIPPAAASTSTSPSKNPSPSKAGVLSLSRLNMLARPKSRA